MALEHRDEVDRGFFVAHCAYLGEDDLAFVTLERLYDEQAPCSYFCEAPPITTPSAPTPRSDDLLRRIGFPES